MIFSRLGLQSDIELDHDPVGHPIYAKWKYQKVRAECEAGHCHCYGLFDCDRFAADMGIVTDARIARLQQKKASMNYRRRGLCAGLLRRVHEHVASLHPAAKFVIEAEADGAAGRIFARAGFRKAERDMSLMKRGF